MYNPASSSPLQGYDGFFSGISSSTGYGGQFLASMVNLPFQLFNNYLDDIIIVAVFGAVITIGWSLWRRWV